MSYGLEVFDDLGRKILDTEDLTKTIYGIIHTNCKSGSVFDSRIKIGETFILPYYSKVIDVGNAGHFYAINGANSPIFHVSQGVITWEYFNNPQYGIEDVKCIYGGSI